ncbi:Uncharacterised protein [Pandoraea pulmonicola]|uniref:Uncharacterized protein n=1 Tax=Pandoraea pulmonicola TaxID=93221 RepID=A0AAJ5D0Q3_PANPU|nr:Uncharacterised protein [Pandoraea pulmonicola]
MTLSCHADFVSQNVAKTAQNVGEYAGKRPETSENVGIGRTVVEFSLAVAI